MFYILEWFLSYMYLLRLMLEDKVLTKKGLSQEAMAMALEVRQSTYCHWENGQTALTLRNLD